MTKTTHRRQSGIIELVLTRGLSASGKSTFARRWVAQDPDNRIRINRDDLRMLTYGSYWLGGDPNLENRITKIQHAMIAQALESKVSVIVDDTHLRQKHVNALYKIAQSFDGRVQMRFQDFPVTIATALERDEKRRLEGERFVGKDVIKFQSDKYMNGGDELPRLPAYFYETITKRKQPIYDEDDSLDHAWIVDIDGTLADMIDRGPYDWHLVDQDSPVQSVIDHVKDLKSLGYKIVLMSGRSEEAREGTELWLDVFEVPYDDLFMRRADDWRKDSIVKSELFEKNIRGNYYVRGVLDDRNQVVDMWRWEKGLLTLQVAEGRF
jgi:predicted kinase